MRLEDLGLRVVASCSLESVGGRFATTRQPPAKFVAVRRCLSFAVWAWEPHWRLAGWGSPNRQCYLSVVVYEHQSLLGTTISS